MGIKCEDRTTAELKGSAHSALSALRLIPDFLGWSIGLEEGRQMSEKPQSHKYDTTSSLPTPPPSYPLQLFFCHCEHRLTCMYNISCE